MLPEHVKRFKVLAATLYAIANSMGDGQDVDVTGMCDDYARKTDGLDLGERDRLANMCRTIVGMTEYASDGIFGKLCPAHLATACLSESDMRKAVCRGLMETPSLSDIVFMSDALDLLVKKGCGEMSNTFWILKQAIGMVEPDEEGRRIITKEIVDACRD